MHNRTLALLAALSTVALALAGCTNEHAREAPRGNERWVTTNDTNVKIDWDKVSEAYKQAEGPADLERRINEIYEGSEVVSVAVEDLDATTQVVTGFFDRNANGAVDPDEKIFTIKRDVVGEGSAQYQIQGHGPHYGYYHSPMFGMATGMMMGMMLSSALRPNYVPMQPYVTSTQRSQQLRSQRNQYRSTTQSKASSTGRSYNSKGNRSWGGSKRSGSTGRSGGGGRFGVRGTRKDGDPRPERLSA